MTSHSFDIVIAEEYRSVDVAIMVWHFQYWIMMNKRLGRNLHEGRTWTYQTLNEIAAPFPYWSYSQVKRLVQKCVDLGILIEGNFNKSVWDKTTWYAFKIEEKFTVERFRLINKTESSDQENEIVPSYKDTDTLPDTLTNNMCAKRTTSPSSRKKVIEEKKEVFEKIWLTPTQEAAFLKKCGNDKARVKAAYTKYSDWKIGKGIEGGNDYTPLSGWVLKSLEQEETKDRKKEVSSIENRKLAEKIWNLSKGKTNAFQLCANYLEIIHGGQLPPSILYFADREFREIALRELKKRGINPENL